MPVRAPIALSLTFRSCLIGTSSKERMLRSTAASSPTIESMIVAQRAAPLEIDAPDPGCDEMVSEACSSSLNAFSIHRWPFFF